MIFRVFPFATAADILRAIQTKNPTDTFILGHGMIGLLGPWIADSVRVPIGALAFQPVELWLIPGLTLLASIVGYLPAVVAYRTDVAQSLNP